MNDVIRDTSDVYDNMEWPLAENDEADIVQTKATYKRKHSRVQEQSEDVWSAGKC